MGEELKMFLEASVWITMVWKLTFATETLNEILSSVIFIMLKAESTTWLPLLLLVHHITMSDSLKLYFTYLPYYHREITRDRKSVV